MEVIFTERFLSRVEEYSDYIALNNVSAAIKWAEQIFDYCRQLRSNPESGRMVPEFRRPEIRELIHGNYRLIYEVKSSHIDMLTIWHGRQQLPNKIK